MSNVNYLHDVFESCDIVCIQEHFLYPDNKEFLTSLNDKFDGYVRCEASLNVFDFPRRRKGGIAIVWRKSIDYAIEPLQDLGNDRIMVVKVTGVNNKPVFIVNAYMPSANYPFEFYTQMCDELFFLYLRLIECGPVILAGDMNAQLAPLAGRQGKHFAECLRYYKCVSLMEHDMCQGPRWTFVPNLHTDGTRIDHICVPVEFLDSVTECIIKPYDDMNTSDHTPVMIYVHLDVEYLHVNTRCIPRWDKIDLLAYRNNLDSQLLGGYTDTLSIDEFALYIVNALNSASNITIPKSTFHRHKRRY